MSNYNFQDKANFIWSIAELLRGDYKQSDYGKVILPLVVLRRLDCVLAPTKEQVLSKLVDLQKMDLKNIDRIVNGITGQKFHNTSRYDCEKLKADSDNIAANLVNYINGFSDNVREIMEKFEFHNQITRLDDANILYQIICRFAEIDLSTDSVDPFAMGLIYEELIRKFAEQSNETAGEHFTPRDVIRLMVNLLFMDDREILTTRGIRKKLYDPACGTGGMLSISEEYVKELNPDAYLDTFGQEINPESYAICKAEMLLKGQDPDNIKFGNSFTHDGLADEKFDYMLSNPPFGVEWRKYEKEIKAEADKIGFGGRFGAGLPRVSDGSLLFLQHMIYKMKQNEGKARLAIVFNGSPMFTGSAGSGESEIRRWIIENDMLEAIVALPDQLFYNTGISTYIWVLTNRKSKGRTGKVQLINAVDFSVAMRKSLGNKRKKMSNGMTDSGIPDNSPDYIGKIVQIYGDFANNEYCKILDNEDFGYSRITVERPLKLSFQINEDRIESISFPKALEANKDKIITILNDNIADKVYKSRPEFMKILKNIFKNTDITYNAALEKTLISALSERDETANICLDSKGNQEPDSELRDYENIPLKEGYEEEYGDYENVPLKQNIEEYFKREVLPHVPEAWIDHEKTKIGYEIPLTRHFYKYQALRPLEEIDAEIKTLESEILELLSEVSA